VTRAELADALGKGLRRRRLERLRFSKAEIEREPAPFDWLPEEERQTWLDVADTVLELLEPVDDVGAIAMLEAVLAWAREEPDFHMDGRETGQNYQRGRVIATDITSDHTVGASTYRTPEEAREKALDMERGYRAWLALKGMRS
jgi:hypothetical protein